MNKIQRIIDYILLVLALIMTVGQLLNGSPVGFAGFAFISYTIIRIMQLEDE